MNEQLFRFLNENRIDTKDLQHLPMVEEYQRMKAMEHKVSYIVCHLSEKYDISERGVFKIVRRFEERIKV